MNRTRHYPDWISPSARAWKVRKRREWKAVIRAAGVFRVGSDYTLASNKELVALDQLLTIITKKLSAKEWGR